MMMDVEEVNSGRRRAGTSVGEVSPKHHKQRKNTAGVPGEQTITSADRIGSMNVSRISGKDSIKPKSFIAPCFKTKMCAFFLKNQCSRGKNCTFAHTEQELKPKLNLLKTRLCARWLLKQCGLAEECPYAHGYDELREPSPTSFCGVDDQGSSCGGECPSSRKEVVSTEEKRRVQTFSDMTTGDLETTHLADDYSSDTSSPSLCPIGEVSFGELENSPYGLDYDAHNNNQQQQQPSPSLPPPPPPPPETDSSGGSINHGCVSGSANTSIPVDVCNDGPTTTKNTQNVCSASSNSDGVKLQPYSHTTQELPDGNKAVKKKLSLARNVVSAAKDNPNPNNPNPNNASLPHGKTSFISTKARHEKVSSNEKEGYTNGMANRRQNGIEGQLSPQTSKSLKHSKKSTGDCRSSSKTQTQMLLSTTMGSVNSVNDAVERIPSPRSPHCAKLSPNYTAAVEGPGGRFESGCSKGRLSVALPKIHLPVMDTGGSSESLTDLEALEEADVEADVEEADVIVSGNLHHYGKFGCESLQRHGGGSWRGGCAHPLTVFILGTTSREEDEDENLCNIESSPIFIVTQPRGNGKAHALYLQQESTETNDDQEILDLPRRHYSAPELNDVGEPSWCCVVDLSCGSCLLQADLEM